MSDTLSPRLQRLLLAFVALVYLHNALPYLTMMPRVNVDEPWVMERAYQVMTTGAPNQPMYGLNHAYLLQPGYGYLVAPWLAVAGLGLFQARLFGVLLGLAIVLMLARIGRHLTTGAAGMCAAIFLAVDSNFLGGVRNARTDIPAVFFATMALLFFLSGRGTGRSLPYFASGAATGLAVLCHGNAFWVAVVLLGWYLVDHWRRPFASGAGYWYAAGLVLTFGPYLAILAGRWPEFQNQVQSFAGDRVPGLNPSFLLTQMAREGDRYRNWYFGLVTNTVPNPLLWAFQACTVLGAIYIAVRAFRSRAEHERKRMMLLGVLLFGSVLIFAGLINNKAHVYMPHLLLGFSLASGVFVQETSVRLCRWMNSFTLRQSLTGLAVPAFVLAYGTSGIAYYEKWYSSARKSELLPYETTAATVRALIPAGPKTVLASPHFWVPFATDKEVSFLSYVAAQPSSAGDELRLPWSKPIYLLVDEAQWLPELTDGSPNVTTAWREAWTRYIQMQCTVHAVGLGTAYGNIAAYQCSNGGAPAAGPVHLLAGEMTYRVASVAWSQNGSQLAKWTPYQDPRRPAASFAPGAEEIGDAVRIAGAQWPGIVAQLEVSPGQAYLVRYKVERARPGDLLYIGRWEEPQVRTLLGSSSAGIAAPLVVPDWFPRDRAFRAASRHVRLLVYSEALQTDFIIKSLDVYALEPLGAHPESER